MDVDAICVRSSAARMAGRSAEIKSNNRLAQGAWGALWFIHAHLMLSGDPRSQGPRTITFRPAGSCPIPTPRSESAAGPSRARAPGSCAVTARSACYFLLVFRSGRLCRRYAARATARISRQRPFSPFRHFAIQGDPYACIQTATPQVRKARPRDSAVDAGIESAADATAARDAQTPGAAVRAQASADQAAEPLRQGADGPDGPDEPARPGRRAFPVTGPRLAPRAVPWVVTCYGR